MEPLDLSSLVLASPSLKRDGMRQLGVVRTRRSTAVPSDPKDHVGNIRQERNLDLGAPSSSRRRSYRDIGCPRPRFACPFHKHDPNRFNSTDYKQCVGESFTDMSTLTEHIWGQHTDLYRCPGCSRRFNSQPELESHQIDIRFCALEPQPELPKDITPATLAALRKMRESQPKTLETIWQNIYQLLFPDDDRIVSPYVESFVGQSEHDSESTPSGAVPSMTTDPTIVPKIDLEVRRGLRRDAARRRRVNRDMVEDIRQDQRQREIMERVAIDRRKEAEQMQLNQQDEEYKGRVKEVVKESSMMYASPYWVPTCRSDLHEQRAESLERGRYKSQISEPQSLVAKNTIASTQHSFLMGRYLEDNKTPSPGSPSRREPRSPAISSPPMGDDFGEEVPRSNYRESPSGTTEKSTELSEEEELQSSDFDDIDTSSRTYLSFDPVKRALFDKQSRQFWSAYNGLSVSEWFALWTIHKITKRTVHDFENAGRATRAVSDTGTPSECPSNSSSSIPPKRKKGNDEDDTNDNRNPSKRSNRTSLQKEGLNLACPFHKHKPWKYNHGILRFRTCSTTPFDAIFRLKEHLRRVHPPPLHCTRCWQTFVDQNSLINHGQADISCQRRQPVSVEGWTAEMGKRVTKRKDETEGERWERIYRELFGKTLTDVPSPYFVPYDLSAANDADLETLLHQEVPQILLNWLRERVNNMEPYVAERFLSSISDSSDSSNPYHGFDAMIGRAIDEAFTTYRSATATANNPETSLTPQSSSDNPSIAGDNSTAQSATWESTRTVPLQSSRDQSSGFEPAPAVIPPESSGFAHQQNNATQPTRFRNPFTESHEQSPPPAAELAPQSSETASNSSLPNPPGQLQSAEEYMQDGVHRDVTSAYDARVDEYMFVNFDLGWGDEEAFLNVPSDPNSAPERS